MNRFKPLFIHQYPDWTQFRYNAQSVVDALGRTRLQEGKLIGIADLLSESTAETEILAQDIWANFTIDHPQKESLQDNGVSKIAAELLKKNGAKDSIRNCVGAIQNAKAPLTTERLFAWHAALGQNKVKQFRTKENSIDSFTGVSPERIPYEMEKFLQWFENSTQDGAIKAAIAHFWFLTIRPFEDGNGTLARMLGNMLLARSENTTRCQYPMNLQILKKRESYLKALAKAQAGNGDLTEWILWFLKTMQEAIEEQECLLKPLLHKLQFSQRNLSHDLSGRQKKIIDAIWNGELEQVFSVKEVAAFAGISHDSALRDIQDLMEKGIVHAEPKGGRSQRYSLSSR